MRWSLLAFLMVLLTPMAAGVHQQTGPNQFFQERQDGQPFHYFLVRDTFSELDPPAGEVFNITFTNGPHHSYQVLDQEITMDLSQTIAYTQESDGVWIMKIYLDGVQVVGCIWRVETVNPGALGGIREAVFNFQVRCDLDGALASGNHTLSLVRSVESGSPAAIDNSVVSVDVEREDVVLLSEPSAFELAIGFSGIEVGLLLALAFIGILVWSRSQDDMLRVVGSLFLIIAGTFVVAVMAQSGISSIWAGSAALAALFFIPGIYMMVRQAFDMLAGVDR